MHSTDKVGCPVRIDFDACRGETLIGAPTLSTKIDYDLAQRSRKTGKVTHKCPAIAVYATGTAAKREERIVERRNRG